MKLSETMKNRLVEIAATIASGSRAVGRARSRTDAALERRGLIQRVEIPWSEMVAITLTTEGAKEADRLRADREEVEEGGRVHMLTPDGNMCGGTGPDTAGTGHVTCEDCWTLLAEEAGREARGVSLCSVSDVATDECGCPDCEALHADELDDDGADEDTETEPALSGEVITHQNTGRGVDPVHADNPDAREAVRALEAAGHTPASINDEEEGDGGTGFRCDPRGGGAVYVYHLVDGADRRSAGEWWDEQLDAYAQSLRAAGWVTITPQGRCVRAMRPGTPEGDVYRAKAPAPAPSVAKYARREGERVIMASDGRGWARSGKKWVHGDVYELEKRNRNPLDGTHTTGWYLYGGVVGYAGVWCASRLLEAAEEASAEIGRLEDTEAERESDQVDEDDYAAEEVGDIPASTEGRVTVHQGAGRGVALEHADNPAARAAIFTLTNAGFTPVTVTGEFDPEPGDGTTGFYVEIRRAGMSEEIVYVHDVLDGKLTWRRDADSKLSDYAKALADAGWSIPTGAARVVRALPPVERDLAEPSIVFEPGTGRLGGAHERRWSIGGRPSRDRAEARNILTDRYGWALEDAEQALEDSARHHAR
ncbi:hypothetical protein [Nocardiopsis alba]|uniref:hypothetical protein n=1 Tax=Nocardiopsis alba TaxID=53437 RepID=UPI003D7496D4